MCGQESPPPLLIRPQQRSPFSSSVSCLVSHTHSLLCSRDPASGNPAAGRPQLTHGPRFVPGEAPHPPPTPETAETQSEIGGAESRQARHVQASPPKTGGGESHKQPRGCVEALQQSQPHGQPSLTPGGAACPMPGFASPSQGQACCSLLPAGGREGGTAGTRPEDPCAGPMLAHTHTLDGPSSLQGP